MKRSKRIETLDKRPVNLDGYINEWPEMGFAAMSSPYDPEPSVRVENGKIVELDGKKREDFDFIDQFIADYAINIELAERSMSVPALDIARMIVDIHVSRKEILTLISGITPARMTEVINHLNVVELMMGMQKMRARKTPGNQAHITNLKDDPVQIAADAAEGALRGFAEEETTMGVARYAPLSSIALLIGSQAGRPGVLTQCSAEEATELELGIRGLTTYAETLSVYGTEKVFIDGDDTPYSKAVFKFRVCIQRSEGPFHLRFRFRSSDGQQREEIHALSRMPLSLCDKRRGKPGHPERFRKLYRCAGRSTGRNPRSHRRESRRSTVRIGMRFFQRPELLQFRYAQDCAHDAAVFAGYGFHFLGICRRAELRQHVRGF